MLVIETEVARPATITIDRGPVEGLVTTEHVLAVVPEPQFTWNPLASVTGLSIIPSLASLRYMLELAGYRDITMVEPVAQGADRYATGDRVVLMARV